MTKSEYKKLNSIQSLLMCDVGEISHDKMYKWGYKAGFNTCRRRIRKALGVLVTNKNP